MLSLELGLHKTGEELGASEQYLQIEQTEWRAA